MTRVAMSTKKIPLILPWFPNKVQNKAYNTAISLTGVSTARAQVLLNVVPVTVTVEDGNSLSTYAFLDSGCLVFTIDEH